MIAYDLVLLVHVLVGLVGFGSVAATGVLAYQARLGAAPSERVLRYFRPGPNLAARALYLVPVLGLALVGMSGDRATLHQAWLLAASGLWLAAAIVARAVVWPAEATLQRLLAGQPEGARAPSQVPATPQVRATPQGSAGVWAAARRAERGAALVEVAYVAAFVLMVAQPH
ncbi:MAG: hypothetical protein ACRDYD_00425 [Acidimicrobiales bacterium]